MSLKVLVLDTSYLLEVYRVPSFHDPVHADVIKKRLAEVTKEGARLFVPFPVVFEVANYIADVRDGGHRHLLAAQFNKAIRNSVESGSPWIITPGSDSSILLELGNLVEMCDRYAIELAIQGIGLSDTAIVEEAKRLKKKYKKYGSGALVHIWTKDRRLKPHEPDAEPNPFLGS